jgi:hypothetical protein
MPRQAEVDGEAIISSVVTASSSLLALMPPRIIPS